MSNLTGQELVRAVDKIRKDEGIKVKPACQKLGVGVPKYYYYKTGAAKIAKQRLRAAAREAKLSGAVKVVTYDGSTRKPFTRKKPDISPVHFTAAQVAHLLRAVSNG